MTNNNETAKKVITKQTLYNGLKVPYSITIGAIFLFASLLYVSTDYINYFNSDFVTHNETIQKIIANSIIFFLFGIRVGLRLFVAGLKFKSWVDSESFVIEIDEVTNKECIGFRTSPNRIYNVFLKHNQTTASKFEWHDIETGTMCYVFKFKSSKKDFVKDMSKYTLSDDLSHKLISYHTNSENTMKDNIK